MEKSVALGCEPAPIVRTVIARVANVKAGCGAIHDDPGRLPGAKKGGFKLLPFVVEAEA